MKHFIAILLLMTSFAARADSSFSDFEKMYGDQVREQLNCIRRHKMTEDNRYLIVRMSDGYVQCMFHDEDTQVYCEVSSGFYNADQRRFSDTERSALAAEGFDMSAIGKNYPMDMEANLEEVAARMLRASYFGFGARVDDIKTFGPFADVCRYIS